MAAWRVLNRWGEKNQDFILIRFFNASDLITCDAYSFDKSSRLLKSCTRQAAVRGRM